MGKLTTHVLDTSAGVPGAGVVVGLYRVGGDGGREKVGEYRTNDDGRVDGALLEGAAFVGGVYELAFAVGDYFGGEGFYDVVAVRFVVKDARLHYHVPLLVSPYGYTTYRGS